MPFKGDMRLGGRHSNVASLNGTASDFVSVPAYGTVLSGPTDTSRNETDFGGFMFYMPYSTTVYADGLGGQTSTETWGLQYLPAGWRTGTGTNTLTIQIEYNFYNIGSQDFYYQEDGTGINYAGGSFGAATYYVYGTLIAGGLSSNMSATTPPWHDECTYEVGTSFYSHYADGNGGTYTQGSDSYLPYGTLLGTCGNYTYYCAGQSGYSWEGGYWPFYWHLKNGYAMGYQLDNSHPNGPYVQNTWAYYNNSGTYTQYEARINQIADGNGGSYWSAPYSWYPPYGDVIGSGSYDDSYYDDNGDWQQNTINFTVYADGNGLYYIQNN